MTNDSRGSPVVTEGGTQPEFTPVGIPYRPGAKLGRTLLLLVLPGYVLIAAVCLFSPESPGDSLFFHFVPWVFLGIGILGGVSGIHHLSRVMMVTDSSISERSLTRTHSIALLSIDRIELQRWKRNGKIEERVTIYGLRFRLSFSSELADVKPLLGYLLVKAKNAIFLDLAEPPQNSPAREMWIDIKKRQDWRGAWVIVSLGLLFVVPSLIGLHRSYVLDHQGMATIGFVDDSATKTPEQGSSTIRMRFTFTANGRIYRGRSLVRREYYHSLPVAAHVKVTYLPENPMVCRAGGTFEKIPLYGFLGIGCLHIPLAAYAFWNSRSRMLQKLGAIG